MSLLAANSCGHLANHLDLAPSCSSITFGISNSIVRFYCHLFYFIGEFRGTRMGYGRSLFFKELFYMVKL